MAGEDVDYELCAALLVPLARALRCSPHGTPAEVRVHMGTVEDACCDSLVVSIVDVQTRAGGAGPYDAAGVDDTMARSGVATWLSLHVTLVRPCWPTVTTRTGDGEVTETESVGERTELAAQSLLADGRILHGALVAALLDQASTFGDLYESGTPSLAWTLGTRLPIMNGPCAGWLIPVTLEVGEFCDFEPCDAIVEEAVTLADPPVPVVVGSVDVRPVWMT